MDDDHSTDSEPESSVGAYIYFFFLLLILFSTTFNR